MAELVLLHPIELKSKTLNKLTFRDYTTASDYLSFDKRGGVAQRIALIASLTGMDEAIIERLRGGDYRRAEKLVDELLEGDEKAAMEGENEREKKSAES